MLLKQGEDYTKSKSRMMTAIYLRKYEIVFS